MSYDTRNVGVAHGLFSFASAYISFFLSLFLSTENCVDVEIIRILLEVWQIHISAIRTSRERLWFDFIYRVDVSTWNIRGWSEKLKF